MHKLSNFNQIKHSILITDYRKPNQHTSYLRQKLNAFVFLQQKIPHCFHNLSLIQFTASIKDYIRLAYKIVFDKKILPRDKKFEFISSNMDLFEYSFIETKFFESAKYVSVAYNADRHFQLFIYNRSSKKIIDVIKLKMIFLCPYLESQLATKTIHFTLS